MPIRGRSVGANTALIAVTRHELRVLLYSPLTYLLQAGMLICLTAAIFLVTDYFHADEASIRQLLVFLPWVALVFVPALAMRAWPGQHEDNSAELMLSLPISSWSMVAGKFLAGWLLLLVTLLFTTPLVFTALYLGAPDGGSVVSGYIGAGLLLAVCYAVSLLGATLTREAVGAYVAGVFGLFLLILPAWDVLSALVRGQETAVMLEGLRNLSPKTWLDAAGSGLLEVATLVYFGLATLVALLAAAVAVEWPRRRAKRRLARAFISLTVGVACLAGIAVVVSGAMKLPFAVDLTDEREHTLHEGTEEILRRLPPDVRATFYWSEAESSVPGSVRSHAHRVAGLLERMARATSGRLSWQRLDPRPDSSEELEAVRRGVRRVPMSSGDAFYLGVTLRLGDRVGVIPYLDTRRERLLEYDLALALHAIGRERTPVVGILSPLVPARPGSDPEGLSFLTELRRAYDVAVIPAHSDSLPRNLDVLLCLNTSILQQRMLYAIDQFVMGGGGLIVTVDPYLRLHRASNLSSPQPSQEVDDISDLLLRYGVRYRWNEVVGDQTLGASVAGNDNQRSIYPYWIRPGPEQLAPDSPVTAALNELLFVESGALEAVDGARVTALVSTTESSGILSRDAVDGEQPQALAARFSPDGQRRVIVAALQGPFASAFARAPTNWDGPAYTSAAQAGTQVMVVADSDWLFDPFSVRRGELGAGAALEPINDNLSLLLNMVELAAGDPALGAIRSRGRLSRPFTRVQQLFQAAESQYREAETQQSERLQGLEQRLLQTLQAAGVTDVNEIPSGLAEPLQELQLEMLTARKALRDIRREIREEVEQLGRRIVQINMLCALLLPAVLAVLVYWVRRSGRTINS